MLENANETRKLWDKRDDEPAKAYHAFSVYLGLGANRSHSLVAKKISHKSNTKIGLWSKEYDWVRRVEAYDLDFITQSLKEHRLRINNVYTLYIKLLEMPAMVLAKKLTESPKALNEMNIKDLYRLILEGAKLLPGIATAQDMNITQFVDDMKSNMPDDDFSKILENEKIKKLADELLSSLQNIS